MAGECGSGTWLLLIYTVPAEPSRKRAFVWREVKKVGAVYLRDGVCVLPEQEATRGAFRAIAAKIHEFGGQATLVEGARLDADRAEAVISQSRAARAEEYGEVMREAERFLAHVRRETEHREFTFAELEELEADLGKLRRWYAQVRARDYFGAEPGDGVEALLRQCEEELGAFLEAVVQEEEVAR
jgi:hypothetical protein